MTVSFKKSFSMILLVFMLALAFAIPASAASQSYEFYYNDNPTSPYNAHVNPFIVGPADVTGTTVTITLDDEYYGYLQADNGSGTFVNASQGLDANGDTTFTFTNSNPSSDIKVKLFVEVPGQHSALYPLTIHWK
ncbi:hypothetical protein [Paenibacillus sp. RC67]|uniref:hypothetical protein n=1 Tax=Paenibacillus sp. RC67 TaxID=3039392 RepID=UPI0024AD9FCA|nr:hypothetical protein [Paenibacillus sp. RC67]